jgi:hypothetical protein
MMRKYQVRFGGGRLEKEPQGHLVSRLPNSIDLRAEARLCSSRAEKFIQWTGLSFTESRSVFTPTSKQ